MITLFTCPKSFEGKTDMRQRNAINSWLRLEPTPRVLLISPDDGVGAVAQELGAAYVPGVEVNESGTPLVRSLFDLAAKYTSSDILCYLNADMMMMDDFMRALLAAGKYDNKFYMVGARQDVPMERPWHFSEDWQARLRNYALAHGEPHAKTGMDYWAFSRGLWGELPPLAIGRGGHDSWLLWWAVEKSDAYVIDATEAVLAVHQDHPHRRPDHLEEAATNYGLIGATGGKLYRPDVHAPFEMTAGNVIIRRP